MKKKWTAPDGQPITNEMIDGWCEAYEKGEFPEGEHTVGNVVYGRPPLSSEGSVVMSIKVPIGMKNALEKKASEKGLTISAAARGAISDWLLV